MRFDIQDCVNFEKDKKYFWLINGFLSLVSFIKKLLRGFKFVPIALNRFSPIENTYISK